MTSLLLALAFLILLTHWVESNTDFHYKKTLYCERWCDPKPWHNRICLIKFNHHNQPKCYEFTECLRQCLDRDEDRYRCGCSRSKDLTKKEWLEETKNVMVPLKCFKFQSTDDSHDTDSDSDMKDCRQTPKNLAYCRIQSYGSSEHSHRYKEYRGCVNSLEYCPENTCCCRTKGCNRDWDTCKSASTGSVPGSYTTTRHLNATSGTRMKRPFASINGFFFKAALVFGIHFAVATILYS